MQSLIAATLGLISRKRVAAALTVLGLHLPAALLIQFSRNTATIGVWIGWAGTVALLVVFLSDGSARAYPISRIVGSLLRAFGSVLIAAVILLVLLLLMAFIGAWVAVILGNADAISAPQMRQVQGAFIGGSLVLAAAFLAPLLLLVFPICLDEGAGPWRALKRSWTISRARWALVWLVVPALLALGITTSLIRTLGGAGPTVVAIALSAIAFVFDTALVAALYRTLIVASPATASPPLIPAVPRSREAAAAGTFREWRAAKSSPRHRQHDPGPTRHRQ